MKNAAKSRVGEGPDKKSKKWFPNASEKSILEFLDQEDGSCNEKLKRKQEFVLPAIEEGFSKASDEFRKNVAAEICKTMESPLADGTMRTYQSVLTNLIPDSERELGCKLLPMDTEQKFMLTFGCAMVKYAKTVDPRFEGVKSVKWQMIKTIKAAIDLWHATHGVKSVMTEQWSTQMGVFWKGMKKRAVHTTKPKDPLTLKDVKKIMIEAAEALKTVEKHFASGFMMSYKEEMLKVRNAASIGIAFFAVKRGHEIINLRMKHVRLTEEKNLRLTVVMQKNDQLGRGQEAFVTKWEEWGAADPVKIFMGWAAIRRKLADNHDRNGIINGDDPQEGFAFISVQRDTWGKRLRSDPNGRGIKAALGLKETLSARKGGLLYLEMHGAKKEAAREQGGWTNYDTMENVYARLSREQVEEEMIKVKNNAVCRLKMEEFMDNLSEDEYGRIMNMRVEAQKREMRKWMHTLMQCEPLITGKLLKQTPNCMTAIRKRVHVWGHTDDLRRNGEKVVQDLECKVRMEKKKFELLGQKMERRDPIKKKAEVLSDDTSEYVSSDDETNGEKWLEAQRMRKRDLEVEEERKLSEAQRKKKKDDPMMIDEEACAAPAEKKNDGNMTGPHALIRGKKKKVD